MPGGGMDTPSPWRQGPDWEAGNITAMEKMLNNCKIVEEKNKEMEKTADTLTDSKRGTALGAKNELQDKLTINVSNEDSKWEISFLTFFASICVEYVSVSVACFLRRLAMTLMCH